MQDQIAPPADPEDEADGAVDVVPLTTVGNNADAARAAASVRIATTKTVFTPLPWITATGPLWTARTAAAALASR